MLAGSKANDNFLLLLNLSLFSQEIINEVGAFSVYTYPYLALRVNGEWHTQVFDDPKFKLYGNIVRRRIVGDNVSYIDQWNFHSGSSGYVAFNLRGSQLECFQHTEFPSRETIERMEDSLSSKEFNDWRVKMFSFPSDFTVFETETYWIPLADLIRLEKPTWRRGDLSNLQALTTDFKTPYLSFQEFLEWQNTYSEQ